MQTTRPRFRGDLLREARRRQGLSQVRLSQKIGADWTSVSGWERGVHAPSGRHLASLCRELGVTVDQLYGDDDEDESDLYGELVEQFRRIARHEAERVHERTEAECPPVPQRSAPGTPATSAGRPRYCWPGEGCNR